MKKEYLKPAMQVMKIQLSQIICISAPRFDDTDLDKSEDDD